MKAVKIKHLEVRCAQVKLSCAILVSSPCAYVFIHFLSTQQASLLSLGVPDPSLQRLDPPRQGIKVFQVRLMLHLRHLPHFPQLGRWMKKEKAGRCWKRRGSFVGTLPRSRFYSWLHHRGLHVMLGKYQVSQHIINGIFVTLWVAIYRKAEVSCSFGICMCYILSVSATLACVLWEDRTEASQTGILKVVDIFNFNPSLPSFCHSQNHYKPINSCEALKHRVYKKFTRKWVIQMGSANKSVKHWTARVT